MCLRFMKPLNNKHWDWEGVKEREGDGNEVDRDVRMMVLDVVCVSGSCSP